MNFGIFKEGSMVKILFFLTLSFSICACNDYAKITQNEPAPSTNVDAMNINDYWVAYVCDAEICVQNAEGTVKVLTQNAGTTKQSLSPLWAPDGSKIFFAQADPEQNVVHERGNGIATVTRRNTDIYSYELSSKQSAYFWGRPLAPRLGIENPSSGIETPLRLVGHYLIYSTELAEYVGSTTTPTGTTLLSRIIDTAQALDLNQASPAPISTLCDNTTTLLSKYLTIDLEGKTFVSMSEIPTPNTISGTTYISQEPGISGCDFQGINKFDYTTLRGSTNPLLEDMASDFHGGLALNSDGSLFHLSTSIKAALEAMLEKEFSFHNPGAFPGPEIFHLSPDHQKLAVLIEGKGLYVGNLLTGNFTLASASASRVLGWANNGQIVLAATEDHQTLIIDLNGVEHEMNIDPDTAAPQISPVPVNP